MMKTIKGTANIWLVLVLVSMVLVPILGVSSVIPNASARECYDRDWWNCVESCGDGYPPGIDYENCIQTCKDVFCGD